MSEGTNKSVLTILASSIKRFKPEFYKRLSDEERMCIYNGALTLSNGFLSFDSYRASPGFGGGALLLSGRLAMLQLVNPYLVRIATDIAINSGFIDVAKLRPDGVSDAAWAEVFKKKDDKPTTTVDINKLCDLWEEVNVIEGDEDFGEEDIVQEDATKTPSEE